MGQAQKIRKGIRLVQGAVNFFGLVRTEYLYKTYLVPMGVSRSELQEVLGGLDENRVAVDGRYLHHPALENESVRNVLKKEWMARERKKTLASPDARELAAYMDPAYTADKVLLENALERLDGSSCSAESLLVQLRSCRGNAVRMLTDLEMGVWHVRKTLKEKEELMRILLELYAIQPQWHMQGRRTSEEILEDVLGKGLILSRYDSNVKYLKEGLFWINELDGMKSVAGMQASSKAKEEWRKCSIARTALSAVNLDDDTVYELESAICRQLRDQVKEIYEKAKKKG